jgi:hypothetical protein
LGRVIAGWVARKVETSRRREVLPWSFHREVAAQGRDEYLFARKKRVAALRDARWISASSWRHFGRPLSSVLWLNDDGDTDGATGGVRFSPRFERAGVDRRGSVGPRLLDPGMPDRQVGGAGEKMAA